MLDEPVIALQGPGAVGKTTLLRALATTSGASVLDLDDPTMRAAVEADPLTFVSGPGPLFIDEYQHVPMVLDAIKAELNRDGSPGRFLISGSIRHDALPRAAQALTGRLQVMSILSLSQAEIDDHADSLVTRRFTDPAATVDARPSSTSREGYIARVTDGGFPPALRPAAQSGQVLNVASAGQAAGLKARTAENSTRLLEALFLVHRLPAWGRTLRARAVATPKLHVVDPGLAARLLRLTPAKFARRDATALQEFGHLLETFVAIEVKASSRVTTKNLTGLRATRDALGEALLTGVVLNTGTRAYRAEDRIQVLPLDRLWTT